MTTVVVTFNRPEYLELCVISLVKTTPKDHRVLVVDNASTDHTGEVLTGLIHNFPGKVFRHNSEINLGCALGRNRGWKILNSMTDEDDYFGMSDDDFYYNDGWYEASRWALDHFPTAGLATCHNDQNRGEWPREGRIEFRDVITTASCMMRKECFRKTKGYTNRSKVLGWVSRDFCRRIITSGYEIVRYIPQKSGVRLVESMDHSHNSKNLKAHYINTGYSYLREQAKRGQLDVGDVEKQNSLLEEGKRNTYIPPIKRVDFKRGKRG